MNCDYTDPGGTPLERLAQQQAGTHPAPCARSCEANAYEIQIRQLSAERDALAAKLKDAVHDRDEFRRVMNGFAEKMAELEGQEPVSAQCRFVGEQQWMHCHVEHHRFVEASPNEWEGYETRALYARPVPAEEGIVTVTTNDAGRCVMVSRQDEDHRILSVIWEAKDVPTEPVNARLLDVATGKIKHLYEGRCPDYVNGPESRDPDCPACQAIVSADAQQGRLLQDMHDAGREIDRVMDEAAPKAVRLTDEEVDICFDGSDGTRIGAARAIEAAALRKNGIEVAE